MFLKNCTLSGFSTMACPYKVIQPFSKIFSLSHIYPMFPPLKKAHFVTSTSDFHSKMLPPFPLNFITFFLKKLILFQVSLAFSSVSSFPL